MGTLQFKPHNSESHLTNHMNLCVVGDSQADVSTAGKILGAALSSIQDMDMSKVRQRAGNITAGPSHHGHNLSHLLSSGRRYRALHTKTITLMDN